MKIVTVSSLGMTDEVNSQWTPSEMKNLGYKDAKSDMKLLLF